jgi:hypothetical protein
MIKLMAAISALNFIGFVITMENDYLPTDALSMFMNLLFSVVVLAIMIGIRISDR